MMKNMIIVINVIGYIGKINLEGNDWWINLIKAWIYLKLPYLNNKIK